MIDKEKDINKYAKTLTEAILKVLELKDSKEMLNNLTNTFEDSSEERGIMLKQPKVKCKTTYEK